MLEWTIGDDQPGSIYGKRVAWVNVSAAPTGAADAHESLRKVLRYAHADVVDEACAAIPVTRRDVADETISNPGIRDAIVKVLTALLVLQASAARVVERNAVLPDVGYLRVSGVAGLETAGAGYRSPHGRQRLRWQ